MAKVLSSAPTWYDKGRELNAEREERYIKSHYDSIPLLRDEEESIVKSPCISLSVGALASHLPRPDMIQNPSNYARSIMLSTLLLACNDASSLDQLKGPNNPPPNISKDHAVSGGESKNVERFSSKPTLHDSNTRTRLKGTLEALASPEMRGRPGGRALAAQKFIRNRLESSSLDAKVHEFGQGNKYGRNIYAIVPGQTKRAIVISAHYDHLGIRDEVLFPGANDNASGVSVVLELAHFFRSNALRHTLIFITFDREELGLEGSSAWVDDAVYPLTLTDAVVNLEMLGRAKEDVPELLVTGYELLDWSKLYRPEANTLALTSSAKEGGFAGATAFARSDNFPFAEKGVIAHTFSASGAFSDPHYHAPEDRAESINYNTLVNAFSTIQKVIIDLDSKEFLHFNERGLRSGFSRCAMLPEESNEYRQWKTAMSALQNEQGEKSNAPKLSNIEISCIETIKKRSQSTNAPS